MNPIEIALRNLNYAKDKKIEKLEQQNKELIEFISGMKDYINDYWDNEIVKVLNRINGGY